MDTPEGIQLGLLAWLCLPLLSTLAATACAVFPSSPMIIILLSSLDTWGLSCSE